MSAGQKRGVHFYLGERALRKWQDFANERTDDSYIESVAGTQQHVDFMLPADAMKSAKAGADLDSVAKRYLEPIAAMQDFDLEFPEPIMFAYYCVYNLFERYALHKQVDDWIIVNQALSAEGKLQNVRQVLTDALNLANEESSDLG